jgi:class 3 adenylate cyclase
MEAHRAQAAATGEPACFGTSAVSETRKLAAILVADIAACSRLTGADEDRILARLRTLRSDLIGPTIAAHHGRIVKRTGDGNIIEFRIVVDAVNCAIEVQSGLAERNAGLPPRKAHRVSRRHPSRRCGRGSRRRPDGRRGQYRLSAGRRRQARNNLLVRGRLCREADRRSGLRMFCQ